MDCDNLIIPRNGSNWTEVDLANFRIIIKNTDAEHFFGSPVQDVDLVSMVPVSALTATTPCEISDDDNACRFIRLMELVLTQTYKDEESSVDDFAIELLRLLGYERKEAVLRSHKDITLNMCHKEVQAKADVCLQSHNQIFMVIQEDKSHIDPYGNPEPPLVAAAIAAFRFNNCQRSQQRNKKQLESWVCPCVIMRRTYPIFYKVTVTKMLGSAVAGGYIPDFETIVQRFYPTDFRHERLNNEGMRPLATRSRILQNFVQFKTLILYE